MKVQSIFILAVLIFTIGCDNKPSGLLHVKQDAAEIEKEKIVEDGNVKLSFHPKLDILFIVDASGSMSGHQKQLSQNIGEFTKGIFANQLLDIHIGVMTTEPVRYSNCGDLEGSPRYVENSTRDREQVLAQNLLVGINGGPEETVLDPLYHGLQPGKLKNRNKGFYREDAYFASVFITDAIDQGTVTPQVAYNFLVGLKGGDQNKVLGYGVFVPEGVFNCRRDGLSGDAPKKIHQYLDLVSQGVGNNVLSLCDIDYGQKLSTMGQDLSQRIEMFVPLNKRPVIRTLVVKYGNTVIPEHRQRGWSYDSSRNGIHLGKQVDISNEPVGLGLEVSFKAAKDSSD